MWLRKEAESAVREKKGTQLWAGAMPRDKRRLLDWALLLLLPLLFAPKVRGG